MISRRMLLLLALGSLVWQGCSGKTPRRVLRPMPVPGAGGEMGGMTSQVPVKESEMLLLAAEDKVRRTVVSAIQAQGLRLRGDRGIDSACKSTTEALLGAGDLGTVASHLRLELQREQITDVSYLPFTFQMPATGVVPGDVLDFIRRETRDRGVTHIGVGAAKMRGQQVLVTAVLLRRLSLLSAFPRQVKEGSRHILWVKPGGPMIRNPKALLASPDGTTEDISGTVNSRGLEVPLFFNRGKGRYVLQILAEDTYGTQVTNQMEIWVGQPPMRVEKPVPEAEWGIEPETQEAQMVELVNRYRERHGLRPLALSQSLVESARAHSEDMRSGHFFGHRSPSKGELGQRTGGISGLNSVAENIAMSVSITWAHDGLVSSPSHRRNLLNPDMTHLGIGVVTRDSGPIRVVYVTQHLGRF